MLLLLVDWLFVAVTARTFSTCEREVTACALALACLRWRENEEPASKTRSARIGTLDISYDV